MDESLMSQAGMVPAFIARSWPEAKGQVRKALDPLAARVEKVILFGCGDSYHAACGAEMAIAEWGMRRVRSVHAMIAGRYLAPRLHLEAGGVLVVGISASGEVARTREALALGAAAGGHTLALTAVPDSSLAKAADGHISLPLPELPIAPGLLSFVASLVMAFAIAYALAPPAAKEEIDRCMSILGEELQIWLEAQFEGGKHFAESTLGCQPILFLGSGPAYASALFGAAKVVEATGVSASAQDVEEWAHVEYFADPGNLPIWLLSANGRSASREQEVLQAARAIGRNVQVSRWQGEAAFSPLAREALSPLVLWAAPVAFAARLAELLGERPFRGFGGGRHTEEGGGASRIQSSWQFHDLEDLGPTRENQSSPE